MTRKVQMVLPTFVGIGPGRTGTTYLYEALLEHPEVTMARGTKETNFFNNEFHRGPLWYASFFRGASTPAIGEISNNYFYSDDVAARISTLIPSVRVITCLRNPFERLRSAYLYRLRAGTIPQGSSLDDAVKDFPDLIESNKYASRLSLFMDNMERSQILILLYEDLIADPSRFLRTVYGFIGVNASYIPSIVDQRVNKTASLRVDALGYVVGPVARSLRKCGFVGLLTRMKRSQLLRRMLFDDGAAEKTRCAARLSPGTISVLKYEWEHEIRSIEEWLSTPLPSWYEPPRSMRA